MFFNPMAYVLAGSAAVPGRAVLFASGVSRTCREREREISYRVDIVNCGTTNTRGLLIGSHVFFFPIVYFVTEIRDGGKFRKKAGAVSNAGLISGAPDVPIITSARLPSNSLRCTTWNEVQPLFPSRKGSIEIEVQSVLPPTTP
jgi:hypothetical protein